MLEIKLIYKVYTDRLNVLFAQNICILILFFSYFLIFIYLLIYFQFHFIYSFLAAGVFCLVGIIYRELRKPFLISSGKMLLIVSMFFGKGVHFSIHQSYLTLPPDIMRKSSFLYKKNGCTKATYG